MLSNQCLIDTMFCFWRKIMKWLVFIWLAQRIDCGPLWYQLDSSFFMLVVLRGQTTVNCWSFQLIHNTMEAWIGSYHVGSYPRLKDRLVSLIIIDSVLFSLSQHYNENYDCASVVCSQHFRKIEDSHNVFIHDIFTQSALVGYHRRGVFWDFCVKFYNVCSCVIHIVESYRRKRAPLSCFERREKWKLRRGNELCLIFFPGRCLVSESDRCPSIRVFEDYSGFK